ncbi:MAG: hypothetical protein AAF657_16845 [Acidobacteriota bacterium]
MRATFVAMMELTARQRPDLLPAYIDMACNSPARFAVLELVSDLGAKEPTDLSRISLKIVTDLDRLEKRRGGWRHPRQVLHKPNVGGLLDFCRARIQNVDESRRKRRLEVMSHKLERAWEREKTLTWITDFIGTPGHAVDVP